MHTSLAFAAWSLLCMVTGNPVPGPILSPSTIPKELQPRQPANQPLTLIAPSISATYLTLHQLPNDTSPATQPNTTIPSPQGFIPYRVPKSPLTLFFHTFGPPVPKPSYVLDALAVSLARVLKITADGKGRYAIRLGFFHHKHVFPNNDNVTITIADFREVGKPMDYNSLRDRLVGIRDFLKEPGREPAAVGYEIEVVGRGYVGTGHLDYEAKGG